MISADKIIFYILCIISLIFGIFGLMAYTKLSNEKFQSTNYCVPCVNSTGDNYNTDGTSVPCETIPNYLLSEGGQNALINALQQDSLKNWIKSNLDVKSATNLSGTQRIKFLGPGGNLFLTNWHGSANKMKNNKGSYKVNPMGVGPSGVWEPWQQVKLVPY